MRKGRAIRAAVLSLATLGICLPQPAMAIGPEVKPLVTDVALADGGLLRGQVINPQSGAGAANLPVTLRVQDQIVATATTDAAGRFAVQRLRGGVHQIIAGENQAVYRFWSPGTAPPSAQVKAIVYMQPATTSQPNVPVTYTDGEGGFKMLLVNPIVIGAVVATAIAVPIALNNSHSASP
jgi:hypothetical protein